jgi:hypothetical protein
VGERTMREYQSVSIQIPNGEILSIFFFAEEVEIHYGPANKMKIPKKDWEQVKLNLFFFLNGIVP